MSQRPSTNQELKNKILTNLSKMTKDQLQRIYYQSELLKKYKENNLKRLLSIHNIEKAKETNRILAEKAFMNNSQL